MFRLRESAVITASVVYFSGQGHTKQLGLSVVDGARSVGQVVVHDIEITTTDLVEGRWANDKVLLQLDESHAIIFGSPTYMGSVAVPM